VPRIADIALVRESSAIQLKHFPGVTSINKSIDLSRDLQELVGLVTGEAAEQELLRRGRIKTGDVLGVVAGTQMASGSTNFMRLHLVTPEEERGLSRRRVRRKSRRKR